jgi:TrmH family RNA methyltransferase
MAAALKTMIRDLHRRPGRERRGLCLAEGVRLVEEALAASVEIRAAAVSPMLEGNSRGRALRAALADRAPTTELTDDELADLAATDQPQGVIAALAWKPWTLEQIRVFPDSVVAMLDAIQDPGNVGTIIRTAWALGAAGVVTLPGTAELLNPKTLRGTMGALFRLPTVAVTEEAAAAWLENHRVAVVAADALGTPLDAVRFPKPVALVFGNEGAGAQSTVARAATIRVAIPLRPDADSLNVAVAAGILLHGARRDR